MQVPPLQGGDLGLSSDGFLRSPRGLAPTLLSIGSMIPTTATKVHFCSYILFMGGGMAGKIDCVQVLGSFCLRSVIRIVNGHSSCSLLVP